MTADNYHNAGGGAVVKEVRGLEILDSRGNPTVEAQVVLSDGTFAAAAAPSGASTGIREAKELRDGGGRYLGRGVLRAAENCGKLGKAISGIAATHQRDIDNAAKSCDNSEDKSNLGANAIIAVSMAVAKAAAISCGLPLYRHLARLYDSPPQQQAQQAAGGFDMPVPMLNVINGGAHANNGLDIQEFMIMPLGFDNFADALRAAAETYHALGALLRGRRLSTAAGDEGGYAPNLPGAESALALLIDAMENAGYQPGRQIAITLDCAASELYDDGVYRLPGEGFAGDAAAFAALLQKWARDYPIVSIEDGCAEDDWQGWQLLTQKLGKLQLVGDDLFVTNEKLLRRGAECGAANALLVKPNQIGTLTETMDAARAAKSANYNTIISHRSGETEHSDIADIAIATRAGQIKTGAPARGERTAKYNRLLRIAAEWKSANAASAGGDMRQLQLPTLG
ncbi:MAG: phosphopyruvate hydratase [Gammaproteobacteria bacterium]